MRRLAFVQVAADDATLPAHVEILADERKDFATALLSRALRRFRSHVIRVRRVVIDNGSADRSRRFAEALRLARIRHIVTRPCTPEANDKAQRFIQARLRGWAYGVAHPTSAARNADMPRWLHRFNRSGPRPAANGLARFDKANKLV